MLYCELFISDQIEFGSQTLKTSIHNDWMWTTNSQIKTNVMTSLIVLESMEKSLPSKWSSTNNIKKDVAQSINKLLLLLLLLLFYSNMKDLIYAHPACIC